MALRVRTERDILKTCTNIDEASVLIEELLMHLKDKISYFEAKKCYRAYYAGKHFYGATAEIVLKKMRAYEPQETKTLKEVHDESLAAAVNITPRSLKRYNQIWDQFLMPLNDCKVSDFTVDMIDAYLVDLTSKHGLTKTNLRNAKTELNRLARHAVKMSYIKEDPMVAVAQRRTRYNYKQTNKKTSTERIFTKAELPPFEAWCNQEFAITGDPVYLAPLFCAYEGTRVGEVCALDFGDYDAEFAELHIRRMLTEDANGQYSLKDHTKGYDCRCVPVFKRAKDVIEKLPYKSGIMFRHSDGSRITTDDINNVLERYARYHGGPVRRSHCLRRTFASVLEYRRVPRERIRELLGHKDIRTTAGYIVSFDPSEQIPVDPFDC